MKTVTEFPRKVVEHPDLGIVMPDGCRLSVRAWIPEDASEAPVPAILEHLPYRKRDGTIGRDNLTHPYFAGHGYACLRVDMRGNGDSEGLMEDEYSEQELQDACDVIAWAASQPWCNGKVGMMGISWGGFNALQVAAKQPPALKAIVTLCSTDDRYADDIHYKGGLLLNENQGWGATMLSYSSRPPDPALVGERWRAMWLDRLENEPFLPATWLSHQTRDAYWKRGSVCEDFSRIKAATLAVGGWGDAYKNAVSRLVTGITEAPAKGIVGPWIHKYPHFAVPRPAIGFLQEALRWWDRWLKDVDTGVEDDPAMRLYLMDSVPPRDWYEERPGRWIAEAEWPATAIESRQFGLGPNGTLSPGAGGPLEQAIRSPQDCGMAGGEYCAIWLGPELPGDQRRDDEKSCCFDSGPLDEAIDIVGGATVRLKLSADRPTAMVAVRLCDVQPDGASTRITYGLLNLSHRNSHEFPEAVVPGETMEIALAPRRCRLFHQTGTSPSRGGLLHLLADGVAVAGRGHPHPARRLAGPAGANIRRRRGRMDLRETRRGRPLENRDDPSRLQPPRDRARHCDRAGDAGDRRRFRRGPGSGPRPRHRECGARKMVDRPRRSLVGQRRDALDGNAVARRLAGAHRHLDQHAL